MKISFRLFADCRAYRVPLLQCPSFLFFLLGLLIIAAMVSTYLIASSYIEEPEVATLIVIGITVLMLVMGQAIVNSFRRLAEASVVKSEFISVASHQLRTPLAAIKWACSIAAGASLSENNPGKPATDARELRLDEYIGIIKDNTERMIRLVNDLLNVSRIDAGELPTKRERVDLKALTEETLRGLQALARASNVTLRLRPGASAVWVTADQEHLAFVLQNLLDNAIRYTLEKGAVQVWLEENANRVTWSVKDSGVGIPDEDKRRVFQKFFRSQNALKYQTVGTGLGLFIVKALIERFGGRVGFISEEGKGSTFWFTLPLVK